MPIILAIESSCDNSSLCIIKNNKEIIFYKNFNQDHMIEKYGGYVPRIIVDGHIINFKHIINELGLLNIKQIDYIAICCGPGLIMSLNIGYVVGIALSIYYNAKVIYIDHIEAHMWSHLITDHNTSVDEQFLSIMMSGGHSIIADVNINNVKILAKSIDDSPGEVFDKIAFHLKVHPLNGCGIEKNSVNGIQIDSLVNLNNSRKRNISNFYHMSFSGIKTRILNYINKNHVYKKENICISSQILIYNEIYKAVKYILKYKNPNYISCVGGVMANNFIKNKLIQDFGNNNTIKFVDIRYAGDNAVMIANLAYLLIKKNKFKSSCCYQLIPYDRFIV
ncbi:tRNA threonylcarbamoyladenosine modification protein TsaD [uncultured bacterium]|nr:tRNA threonylcarbamoyladenosine modification protein TsaD [uncultured bacterium]